MPVLTPTHAGKTAFVFAGGGSLGAVQVGMLRTLLARGFRPDLVVGASVGAINAAYLAGDPTPAGVARLESIWRGLKRGEVFPAPALRGLVRLLARGGHLLDARPLERLLTRHFGAEPLERKRLPCAIVATDLLSGVEVRITTGSVLKALLASAAIPGIFPPVTLAGRALIDGSVANHSPLAAAVALGATRLIVLPTGYSCTRAAPPTHAIASALHALNILVAGKLVNAIYRFGREAEILVVPPLCPLDASPFDFSRTDELIARAAAQTAEWLDHGTELVDGAPHQLIPHTHEDPRDPYGARVISA